MLPSLVSTPQELQPLISHNADSAKPFYLVFYAAWCPDCQDAEQTIDDSLAGRDAVQVIVGEKATWKTPNNVFRQSPYNITSIPTIVRMEAGKEAARIVERDILDEAKLSQFME